MDTDETAKQLLDLPPDQQRDIAGCLLQAANDKEKQRRAGAFVADELRRKIGGGNREDSHDNTGLSNENPPENRNS